MCLGHRGGWPMRLSESATRRRLIGLTPLIDVVFLLLVFFMLASTFLKFGTVKIDTGGGRPATGDVRDLVLVHVGKAMQVSINGAMVNAASVALRFDELRKSGRSRVVIALRPGAQVSDLAWLVGLARQSGFKAVQVVK